MSTFCGVRAIVRTDVADAARNKAETEGHTLAEKVAELLAAYAEEPAETGDTPVVEEVPKKSRSTRKS